MLTLLTIYLWSVLLLLTALWLHSLVAPVTLVPTSTAPISPLALVVIILIGVPLVWLQAVALAELGFPSWIAWVVLALTLLSDGFRYRKAHLVHGHVSAFPAFSFLLAWYGLSVFRAAG